MPISYALFRDQLLLDGKKVNDIKGLIARSGLPPGTALLIAARIVEVRTDLEIQDLDLIVLADSFDGTNGVLRLRATGQAAQGQAGAPGRAITVAARVIHGLKLETVGGVGGKGFTGATGQDGENGQLGSTGPALAKGGDGGPGAKGGLGGSGGTGGSISIVFETDAVSGGLGGPATIISSLGGEGGPGGDGGPGGKGGEGVEWCRPSGTFCGMGTNGNLGPNGPAGDAGQRGSSGPVQREAVDANTFFQRIRLLGGEEWANYRLEVGEYYYRAFNASDLTRGTYLDLAYTEMSAVVAMDFNAAIARRYMAQIEGGLTFFGEARDLDIVPKFTLYASRFASSVDLVNSARNVVRQFFLTNVNLQEIGRGLDGQIAELTSLVPVLEQEVAAAKASKRVSEIDKLLASQRAETLKQQIAAKRQELDNTEVDVAGAIIGTVFLVASLVAAIPTGGLSLAGAATSIAALAQTLKSVNVIDLAKDAFKDRSKLPEDAPLKQLERAADGLKGYVDKAQHAVSVIISFNRLLSDTWQAKVDNPGYQKLIEEGIQASHAVLLAALRMAQNELAIGAAQSRVDQCRANTARAQERRTRLSGDVATIEAAAFEILQSALRSADITMRYLFYAIRAFEVYTAKTQFTELVRFDYGHVHPDSRSDYQEGFASLAQLVTEMETSWSGLIQMNNVQGTYDEHFNFGRRGWGLDYARLSFADLSVLGEFQQTLRFPFTIRPDDLLPGRLWTHVEKVSVALDGATSDSGTIQVSLEHSGYFTQRTDAGDVTVALSPRRANALAATRRIQDGDFGGEATGVDAEFYHRGVSSAWVLRIEPAEITRQHADLANLREI